MGHAHGFHGDGKIDTIVTKAWILQTITSGFAMDMMKASLRLRVRTIAQRRQQRKG
jgi:hypothetical protein